MYHKASVGILRAKIANHMQYLSDNIHFKMRHKTSVGILRAKITNHMQYLSDNIHYKMCHKTTVGISTAIISGHSKKSSVGVDLRAGGDPNRSEKLAWMPVTQGRGLKKCLGIRFLSSEFCSCSKKQNDQF